MNKELLKKNFYNIGLFFWIVLITIGFATTNDQSRLLVEPLRQISIVIVSLCLIFLVALNGIKKDQIKSFAIYFALSVFGVLLSLYNDAFEIIGWMNFFSNFAVTTVGFFILTNARGGVFNLSLIFGVIIYVSIALIVTIIISGLSLDFPPRFIFEFNKNNSDAALYSQGASQFYGIGAIAAAYFMSVCNIKIKKYSALILMILFLFLSFLGGARGESVGALIVVYFILFKNFRVSAILIPFLLFYIGKYYLDDALLLDNFVVMNRLLALGSDNLGQRDMLLAQSFDLLDVNFHCLFHGCGFAFFQKFYGYEVGMYPHNFLAEALITFGLPITLMMSIFVMHGVFRYYKFNGKVDFLILILLYQIIINLKSGSLTNGWFMNAAFLFFISLSINHVRFKLTLSEKKDEYSKIYKAHG